MKNGLPSGEKRVIKADDVLLGEEAVQVPLREPQLVRAPDRPAEGEPEVSATHAEDGTVQTIEVRCPCGRVTVLQCDYSEQGAEDEPEDP